MTIVVAYVPRPEGQAALDKGIEIAKSKREYLIVINASPGGYKEDPAIVDTVEAESIERLLDSAGIDAEFRQFVRGSSPVDEINNLIDAMPVSLLVIGIRQRSPIGKLIMGSVAQELLLTVNCPVLAVKAN